MNKIQVAKRGTKPGTYRLEATYTRHVSIARRHASGIPYLEAKDSAGNTYHVVSSTPEIWYRD